jgi:Tfp pilus assembly protein PilX
MRDRSARDGRPEPGFVLVGVVMLILALTILGLSLFALSSYEAQFFNESIFEQQAFQSAMGGVERVKYALSTPAAQLEYVQQNLPLENVVHAVALQYKNGNADPDSTGDVEWDPTVTDSIVIRVTSKYPSDNRGVMRTVVGRYKPKMTASYYKRLVTVTETIGPAPNPSAQDQTVQLTGAIWQGSTTDLDWKNHVAPPVPTKIKTAGVPSPDAAAFVASHLPATQADWNWSDPNIHQYTLSASPNTIGYFTWPDSGADFSILEGRETQIHVTGTVVWMFRRGVHFYHKVTVQGGSGACLAIIGLKNGTDDSWPDAGVWFEGGLETNGSPVVILVSDGRVIDEQHQDNGVATSASSLSIFAKRVYLMGPVAPPGGPPLMQLGYDPSLSDAVIDTLAVHSALPNATPARGTFDLAAGSWREIRP